MHKIQMKSLLCALLLVGCAGQIQTNTTYDDSADFAAYRTFAQAPAPTYATDMPGYSEITGRNIQEQIAKNLQQKGLQPAGWDDADLQVSFTLGGQARQNTEYWGGWGWYGAGEVETENYVQGSLVIDMADRAKKRLVWHGFGTENLFSEGASRRNPRARRRCRAREVSTCNFRQSGIYPCCLGRGRDAGVAKSESGRHVAGGVHEVNRRNLGGSSSAVLVYFALLLGLLGFVARLRFKMLDRRAQAL